MFLLIGGATEAEHHSEEAHKLKIFLLGIGLSTGGIFFLFFCGGMTVLRILLPLEKSYIANCLALVSEPAIQNTHYQEIASSRHLSHTPLQPLRGIHIGFTCSNNI